MKWKKDWNYCNECSTWRRDLSSTCGHEITLRPHCSYYIGCLCVSALRASCVCQWTLVCIDARRSLCLCADIGVYVTLSCHSRHCREESICGLWTADNTTCHGCHLESVQERSPSPVHKLGTNSLHPFVTRTVSQLLSVTSKLYTIYCGVWCNW